MNKIHVINRQQLEKVGNVAKTSDSERGSAVIGKRLAKIRRDCGFTQLELAKKLKTTQSIVSRYESGEFRIHAELLLKLSKILSVTPNDILGIGKKDAGTNGKIPRRFLNRLRDVHLLSKRDQDTLAQTMDALIKTAERRRAAK